MQMVVLGLSHPETLLIDGLRSLFGVLRSGGSPDVRWLSDRIGQWRTDILLGQALFASAHAAVAFGTHS